MIPQGQPDEGATGDDKLPRPLRVLAVVDHYLPGFKGGGPVRSIANLVDCLADRIEFDVATADTDLGDSRPYPGIQPGRWERLSGARVRYLARSERTFRGWLALLRQHRWDVVYLNSVFSRSTISILAMRRLGLVPPVPVLLAPRGAFHPGALSVHPRRKRAWLACSRWPGLYGGLQWQAATPAEAKDIERVLAGRVAENQPAIHVARQVPLVPDARDSCQPDVAGCSATLKTPGSARIAFISRISPKKNLDYALRVLRDAAVTAEFDIYGPIEDERYWRHCNALITPGMRVRYCGALAHESVLSTFARYHLFLFPTRGESFGHIVLESLLAGCPVLVSDQTPWTGLARQQAGWDLPLGSPEAFGRCLRQVVQMDAAQFAVWTAGARRAGRRWASDTTGVEAHCRMFYSVARGNESGRPAQVTDRVPIAAGR